ncbi:MAG: hypothetical protein AB7S71_24220 [Dongiaceae bacterium]
MPNSRKAYPDNTEIFARKAEGRRQRAAATFAEKLAALDELRDRVAPIVRAREARRDQHLRPRPERGQSLGRRLGLSDGGRSRGV